MILQAVLGSVAPSTRRSYLGAAKNFLLFCRTLGCRGDWPMKESLLLSYMAHLWERGASHRTIRVQLAGLSFYSKLFKGWDPGSSFLARRAINGWRRQAPGIPDARRPITKNILQRLLQKLHHICLNKYEVYLTGAAFTLAFYGAFRSGELLSPARTRAGAATVALHDVTLHGDGLLIWLQKSKTDQLGKGISVHIRKHDLPVCPVRWVSKFLKVRPDIVGPLLIHRDGSYFSRFQFMAVLRLCLNELGLPAGQFGSHSFRIGAATQALQDGASTKQIMKLGRWRSAAYKGYLRPDMVH
ncbi:integrase/recombinase xerD homolog [Paroedura picta]|uniref:integrase/recombinase xerD homolog n=1 Tax=Paroedura picta TaxID=143630 RepID=UPI004056A2CF